LIFTPKLIYDLSEHRFVGSEGHRAHGLPDNLHNILKDNLNRSAVQEETPSIHLHDDQRPTVLVTQTRNVAD